MSKFKRKVKRENEKQSERKRKGKRRVCLSEGKKGKEIIRGKIEEPGETEREREAERD